MHIGIITSVRGYQWAGSEELWYAFALRLLEQDAQITAVINSEMKDSPQLRHYSTLGGKIAVKSNFFHPRLSQVKERILPSYNILSKDINCIVVSLGSLLDLIFTPGLVDFLITCHVPYVLLCQFNAESLAFNSSHRSCLQSIAQSAAGCVFVSQQNLRLAERQLAMNLASSKIIYNPIRFSIENFFPWPDINQLQLACVARMETLWKGHDVLLNVLSEDKWKNRAWHLNLYGEGPDLEYIKNLVNQYQLDDRVSCHGYVRDIETVWHHNHLMVLASRGEGTPLSILEAMMCGRPTVTTDVGGNREILEEGKTGFIADTATPYSFDVALERAWQASDRWETMGHNAHLKAKELAKADPAQQLLNYVVECTARYKT